MEWSEHKGKGGVGPLILKKEIVLNVVFDLSDTHMWIIGLKSVSQNQTLSNANLSFTTCDTEQNAQINMFLECLYFLLMEELDISSVLNFIFLLMLRFEKALVWKITLFRTSWQHHIYPVSAYFSFNWSDVYTERSQPRVLCFSGCIIHQMDISEIYCASVTANLSNFSQEFEIKLDGPGHCLSHCVGH